MVSAATRTHSRVGKGPAGEQMHGARGKSAAAARLDHRIADFDLAGGVWRALEAAGADQLVEPDDVPAGVARLLRMRREQLALPVAVGLAVEFWAAN